MDSTITLLFVRLYFFDIRNIWPRLAQLVQWKRLLGRRRIERPVVTGSSPWAVKLVSDCC